MKSVSYRDLKNKRINIIDLQPKEDYLNNHFYNSVNMSYDYVLDNYRNLFDKNQVYYFYCYSGKLSKRIVSLLTALGYNAIVLTI